MLVARKTILGATLLMATFTPAIAADAVIEIPPVETAPVFVWTGGYVGLQVGYAWGQSTYDTATNASFADIDPDGVFGGAYAGYSYQFGNGVVVGIEGDINASGIDGRAQFDLGDGTLIPGTFAESDIEWTASVRGRLGYGMDRFLPYITGGVAVADYDHTLIGGPAPFEYGETYVGWTIGGGLEYAFTDNITTRVEYRYSDYGDEDFAEVGPAIAHNVDLNTHDVRIGVSYKF